MKDKFEFTHEFTMAVIIEYQQSTVFSVAGIKLRTKLRPRETELTGQVKKTEFLEKTSVFVWSVVTNYLLTEGDMAPGSNQSTKG